VPEQRLTVLAIVQDDDLRALIRHMLEGADYDVLVAGKAADALGLASSTQIDLLLTEASPALQGRAVAGQLRDENPDLAVLYIIDHPDLTGLEEETTLSKPFTRDELRREISILRPERA
jgi:DNA-binding response OmpR family regulator